MQIKFIKLGNKGSWEKECIENNTIRLGYESPHHEDCLNGNWDSVWSYWNERVDKKKGVATRHINQIKDFYNLSESDIWITFYKRKMYWCHAYRDVVELEDGSKVRKVIGSWTCHSKNGKKLSIENIDGRVTQVQGFRGTICDVQLQDYLNRKIEGNVQPEVEEAEDSLSELKLSIAKLIKGLWWNDFEVLVDLIFSRLGWQRISALGKTEKDIDLDIFSPVTGKRAFVQVKSSTDIKQIKHYYQIFKEYDQYDEMYLIYHSFKGNMKEIDFESKDLHLWDLSKLSELIIYAGLVEWIITKRK